jgi:hypothetical protein
MWAKKSNFKSAAQLFLLKIKILEFILVTLISLSAIFISLFPTIYLYLHTPKEYFFLRQIPWFDKWDVNVFISYIRYGERVGVPLQNTFTTIPHQAVLIYSYYTTLGVLNRVFHLDPFLLFYIASFTTDLFLLALIYFIVGIFIKKKFSRLIIFAISVAGGGLGWIPAFKNLAADVLVPDFTLVKPLFAGHDAANYFCILAGVSFLYLSHKYPIRKVTYLTVSILASICAITIHPYNIPLFAVVFLWMFFIFFQKEKMYLLYPLIICLFLLPYGYFVLLPLEKNPGFSGITKQVISTQNIVTFILGFGLLIPFLLYGLFATNWKNKDILFVKLMFLTQIIFIYLPLGFARGFLSGLFLWGALLSYYGVWSISKLPNIRLAILSVLLIISLITPIYMLNTLLSLPVSDKNIYIAKQESDALTYLTGLPDDSTVIALYRMGNTIPAFTNNRVYFGHFFQTPDGLTALRNAELFYISMNEKQQKRFLKENHISYVYYGQEEALFRIRYGLLYRNPFPYFKTVYSNEKVIIYSSL